MVERPAAVVKELMENSIDANSKKITIEVEGAGKKLIRVSDDGSGIAPEDMKLAFEKHSTSKITDIKDLNNLSTLGFRGEALASIAAVSRVECISCDGKTLPGRKLALEAGKAQLFREIGCAKGTTIKVKDLFFNLPVRLKYMKSEQTELTHIIDMVTRFAIYHHDISFKLIHNGHELLNFPAVKSQINNLVNIFGKDLVREMIPLDSQRVNNPEFTKGSEPELDSNLNFHKHKLTISGFIGKPTITRADKGYQFIYINGRYVESKVISESIKEAYKKIIMKNRFPLVILFITIDPVAVDVNISPTKLQVRFENDKGVFNTIYGAIHGTLKMHDLIPEVRLPSEPEKVTLKAITTIGIGKPGYLPPIQNKYIEPLQNIPNELNIPYKQVQLKPEFRTKLETFQHQQYDNLKTSTLRHINPIGQVMDTYIIAQAGDSLLIIDQHAASERIMYERISKKYQSHSMSTQELLEPVELEFAPRELALLRSNLDTLKTLNFVIDEMGDNRFYVKGIPIILGRLQEPELIHDIINDLITVTGETKHEQIKDKMLQIMACKAAVKAGKAMNMPEIQELLSSLYAIENPYTCAHGRPTIIALTDMQLRKMFKRIV